MSRSVKKGPFVAEKLMIKISRERENPTRRPIKTWARSSMVVPEMVGLTFLVHNGKKFISVFVNENMIGHRLGEFSPTRYFRAHGGRIARKETKGKRK